ncbi:MAG: membrane associated rhomboid family serine protease [Yoonia sp.]|jgi:membrane associated rhomboid family serine protease
MDNEPAVNPIPPVVIVLCLIVVLVELVLSAAAAGMIGGPQGIGWRLNAMQDYGFSPVVLDRVISVGDYSLDLMKRFVTYGFVHASFTQALFAAALLLALGKFVGDVFSGGAVLLVVFGSMIFGAVVFGVIAEGTTPLLGIYPAVYGLIGAYTYLIWLRLGASGQNQLKAFQLIGFLLGLQLVFGLLFGSSPVWIAELAGFVFGFTVSTVAAPGGWAALVTKLRERS